MLKKLVFLFALMLILNQSVQASSSNVSADNFLVLDRGQIKARLGTAEDGSPIFALRRDNGEIGTYIDNNYISLADDNGTVRLILMLTDEGTPAIVLKDSNGKTTKIISE